MEVIAFDDFITEKDKQTDLSGLSEKEKIDKILGLNQQKTSEHVEKTQKTQNVKIQNKPRKVKKPKKKAKKTKMDPPEPKKLSIFKQRMLAMRNNANNTDN